MISILTCLLHWSINSFISLSRLSSESKTYKTIKYIQPHKKGVVYSSYCCPERCDRQQTSNKVLKIQDHVLKQHHALRSVLFSFLVEFNTRIGFNYVRKNVPLEFIIHHQSVNIIGGVF